MHVLGLYLTTLPIGYLVVSPIYPGPTLPWRDFWGMALLIVIWPLTLFVVLMEGGRR